MFNLTDKFLNCMAATAEELFLEAMGLASCGGAYEPELSKEADDFKKSKKSKIEAIYDRIVR